MRLTKAKLGKATSAQNEAAAELIREILDSSDWSFEDISGRLQGPERIEFLLTLASSAVRIYRATRSAGKRSLLARIVRDALLEIGIQRRMSVVDVMIHLEGKVQTHA